MNVFRTSAFRALALGLALPLAALVGAGCDVGATDSTAAVLSDNSGTIYNFAWLYMNPNNSTNGILPLVYPHETGRRPSGEFITSLRLLQYGSVLEAYDSAGLTWSGGISALQSGTATFSLRGRTTTGISVEIAGTLIYADQHSTMDATWIEPTFYGNLYAQATVAPSTTNNPVNGDVTLVSDTYSVASNGVAHLTASGGSSYTWSGVSFGTLTSSGGSATYTRTSGTSANSETISVTSGSDSDSVTIEFD